jgi:hypothetical protein
MIFVCFSSLEDCEIKLQLCFDPCNQDGFSLNSIKCQLILILKGKLSGRIIFLNGISMDLSKIEIIFLLLLPEVIMDV